MADEMQPDSMVAEMLPDAVNPTTKNGRRNRRRKGKTPPARGASTGNQDSTVAYRPPHPSGGSQGPVHTSSNIGFNGRSYVDFHQLPARRNTINASIQPIVLRPDCFHNVNATNSDVLTNPKADGDYFSLAGIKDIWTNAYTYWKEKKEQEANSQYSFEAMTNVIVIRLYISAYMSGLALLQEIVNWQSLEFRDDAHRVAAAHANKLSRSRLNGAIQRITSFPMWKEFHDLALFHARPAYSDVLNVIAHHYIVPDPQLYLSSEANLGFARKPAVNVPTPDADAYFTNALADAELCIAVLTATHAALSDADKLDVLKLRLIMRAMDISTNPTSYDDMKDKMNDHDEYCRRLYHGMIGIKISVSSATDEIFYWPVLDASLGDTPPDKVLIRGPGDTPSDMVWQGLHKSWTAVKVGATNNVVNATDSGNVDATDIRLFGMVAPAGAGAAYAVNKQMLGVSAIRYNEQGSATKWGGIESGATLEGAAAGFPYKQSATGLRLHDHAYAAIDQARNANFAGREDRWFSPAGHYGWVDPNDIITNHLIWLSQTLGVPYLG